jgi:phosphoribosylglycinamide formyltransferase-1
MSRVGILISGNGSNMLRLVEDMRAADHPAEPVVVLSNDPRAGGLDKARMTGVPTEVVDHRCFGGNRPAFENALSAALARHAPDVLCLAGFMRILSEDFVNAWQGRMLNIHPSLLPKYRGLHTHARALAAGEREHGCTVHLVTPDLDDGPILGQARIPVVAGDTEATLQARVSRQEHRLYPIVLRRFLHGDTRPVDLG